VTGKTAQNRRQRPALLRVLPALAVVLLGPAGASGRPALAQAIPGEAAAAPLVRVIPPPTLNFYGSPGLMDMPSAQMLPDGQFTTGVSWFGGNGRFTLGFQALPWLSASFRYSAIQNWNMNGFDTYYDRGFDLRFRLLQESRRWPEVTLGLQDFIGTGIYAGEYIVATKTFPTAPLGSALPGRLKVTGGIGWGRLGSYNSFGGSPGSRPGFEIGDTGGELSYDQWFRGPYAAFAGIEWEANDRLGFKVEYSSDDYIQETRSARVFERDSPFNFGVEYQLSPATRLGAYYMYGSELGFNLQFQLNPVMPSVPLTIAAPQPVAQRPDRAAAPQDWSESWAGATEVPLGLRDALSPLLIADGLILESLEVSAQAATLRFRNIRYQSYANAVGRAARALAEVMPPSVETFHLVPVANGMALSAVTLRRSDLEALEFVPDNGAALLAVTGFSDAAPAGPDALPPEGLYPDFSWSLSPYALASYFDPDRPFRIDVGLALGASFSPAPGWVLAGSIRHRIAGNIADGRQSPSALPPVRTNAVLFAQEDTTLNRLYGARYWRPGQNLYARVTAGYLESMYGGLSTELLWKPVNSRLALGIEANYARQRDFDQRFGFQDYDVFTGHASAYYDIGGGYQGQIDVGRYLAGDVGATFSLDRIFENGWLVGGFFTLTDVSAEDFGEGSFDKGIRLRIPLTWFLGDPSQRGLGAVIRPIQRDGGARLSVPGRLYGQVREAHGQALSRQWGRVWE
jgi:hypothetical protein